MSNDAYLLTTETHFTIYLHIQLGYKDIYYNEIQVFV